ncbi:MAG: cobalt-precorrin-7 (C(5))-methyltransferase [Methanolinea sp.]|nr:cobalt-precorrin-7 (C(5))-methyltransferase [Methanolinea sp.]
MKIVGVGCGPGLLTLQAVREISSARLVYGSRRAIELAREYFRPDAEVREIEDYGSLKNLPADAVVLSTGDPMLAGLGYLPGEVVPGISSLQLALARLRIPMQDTTVVVAHGRDHAAALGEIRDGLSRGKTVFVVADPGFDVRACAESLVDFPGEVVLTVCENLGYPGERIEAGTPREPPLPRTGLFSLVLRVANRGK